MAHGDTVGRLTEAAYDIIANHGRLTLDAVAQRAGMSKGAITHRFRSKVELAEHVLRESNRDFDRLWREYHAQEEGPGAWTRAYLSVTLDKQYRKSGHRMAPLLVAVSREPELDRIMAEATSEWIARIENDGLDPVTTRIICSAADGFWWSGIAGGPGFRNDNERTMFIQRLSNMTR